jgi:hypothetical protein
LLGKISGWTSLQVEMTLKDNFNEWNKMIKNWKHIFRIWTRKSSKTCSEVFAQGQMWNLGGGGGEKET